VAAASGEAARHPTAVVVEDVPPADSAAVATSLRLAVDTVAASVEAEEDTSQPRAAADTAPAVAVVTAVAEATTAADTKL